MDIQCHDMCSMLGVQLVNLIRPPMQQKPTSCVFGLNIPQQLASSDIMSVAGGKTNNHENK